MKCLMRRLGVLALIALVSACAGAEVPPARAPDPFEPANRAVHAFNKSLDRNVLKPVSEDYVASVPGPVRKGISNGVNNLSQPLYAVNHLLQGDIEGTVSSVTRFGINTLVGLGGLLDPASEAGVYSQDTDFGETLAVWGVPSGPYVELPVFGPSTVRDAAGRVVDIAGDPVNAYIPAEARPYYIGARVADLLQTRQDMARVIETLLYESADSYRAARIAYLQNRARNANDGLTATDLEDPYAFQ